MLEILECGSVAESLVLGLLLLMELAQHHQTSFDPLAQAPVMKSLSGISTVSGSLHHFKLYTPFLVFLIFKSATQVFSADFNRFCSINSMLHKLYLVRLCHQLELPEVAMLICALQRP